jgi:hypothetical protein
MKSIKQLDEHFKKTNIGYIIKDGKIKGMNKNPKRKK